MGVWSFAAAAAAHPGADVGAGGVVHPGVCAGFHASAFLDQRNVAELIGFHVHGFGVLLFEAAFTGDEVFVEVERAAVRTVQLFDVTCGVGLPRGVNHL